MKVLLVWPRFKSRGRESVPLGLLKLATWYRRQGADVCLKRDIRPLIDERPDLVLVSSLFTWAWHPVVEQMRLVQSAWPEVGVQVGGIYATLMPDHVEAQTGIRPHVGLHEAEHCPPAWDLWPGDTSVTFASRGCIRRCPWCSVAIHDGPEFCPRPIDEVLACIDSERPKVELWDNNILAHPGFEALAEALITQGKRVEIRQGLDARLVTRENATLVRHLRGRYVYLAYDHGGQREAVERAIAYLREAGVPGSHILVYVLYNFYDPATGRGDTPTEIYQRVNDICCWGACAYPIRYRPVTITNKAFVSPLWDEHELWLFNRARGDASNGTGVIHLDHFDIEEYCQRRAEYARERQGTMLLGETYDT